MAIYHLSAKIITRGKGKSTIDAAAYISSEKLKDDYQDMTHDYTRKGGVVHSEILKPNHAPDWCMDRQTLWNNVELSERNKNAQLARELNIALPVELPYEQQLTCLREYVQENFVSKGMIADLAIHNTDGQNPHAHILLTMREIGKNGKWQPKSKKEYNCDKNGDKIRLPSGEYKSRKVDANNWNKKETLERWRENWSDIANKYLGRHGRFERIDHRSYEKQGIEKEPTIHMGPYAAALEKRGMKTRKGNINRMIKEKNIQLQISGRNIKVPEPKPVFNEDFDWEKFAKELREERKSPATLKSVEHYTELKKQVDEISADVWKTINEFDGKAKQRYVAKKIVALKKSHEKQYAKLQQETTQSKEYLSVNKPGFFTSAKAKEEYNQLAIKVSADTEKLHQMKEYMLSPNYNDDLRKKAIDSYSMESFAAKQTLREKYIEKLPTHEKEQAMKILGKAMKINDNLSKSNISGTIATCISKAVQRDKDFAKGNSFRTGFLYKDDERDFGR